MSEPAPDSAAAAATEVRGLRPVETVLAHMLSWVVRGWLATLRFEADEQTQRQLRGEGQAGVVALWHNRVFLTPELYRRYRRGGRQMVALISASRDGSWLALLLGLLGVRTARGSSSRRSLTAVRELRRLLAEGHDVTITPDGPRGPCYDFKVGPVYLARLAKCPVLLINAEFTHAWRLRSWDRTYLPWPGSKVRLRTEWVVDLAAQDWESNEAAAAWLRARLLALVPADAADLAAAGESH